MRLCVRCLLGGVWWLGQLLVGEVVLMFACGSSGSTLLLFELYMLLDVAALAVSAENLHVFRFCCLCGISSG
jgi:hypothetical protein